jgi:hypothetical protein
MYKSTKNTFSLNFYVTFVSLLNFITHIIMKKLIFSCAIALATAVSFSSCDTESCYTCESAISVGCTLDICGGIASSSSGTACQAVATTVNAAYSNNDKMKEYLELAGYTCTKK